MNRKQFQKDLDAHLQQLQREIETACTGLSATTDAMESRRAQVLHPREGYRFFAQTYFPHYVRSAPSILHQYLFERLPDIVNAPSGVKQAIAAPRGEAKSTLITQIFVLWCALRGVKRYIPIIMDAYEQASMMLESLKLELEQNPRLQQDFPDFAKPGRAWKENVLVTANEVKIEVFGSGKRLRGRRHGPWRPDLVILDDIENDENVRSPEQRDKLESWLTKTVLKLGPADDSLDVIYIGTLLHYDSVLARTLKNPLWRGRTFRALIDWPHDMTLWDRWEEVLRNDGETAADAFYADRRAAMDAGAVLSWPDQRPLLTLMKVRARDGHSAFDSEYQNDPIHQEHATFGRVMFWVQRSDRWLFFGAVDPSLGKAGNSRDPSAILVGGLDRDTGILDVVEADIKKRLPDRLIEDIIARQKQYACRAWAVEAVQFQEFFRQELVKRSAAQGCPVPAIPVTPHGDKLLRIETLQPHIANGLIRFHPSQVALLEQLRHFPQADHDDGPDALEMLWKLAQSRGRQTAPDYSLGGMARRFLDRMR
jgi:predicted phage terminase large subunit-like protein